MARLLCNECVGLYDEQLPPDPQYFHHCPPRSMVTIYVGVDKTQLIPLQALQKQVIKVQQADGTTALKGADLTLPGDVRLGDVAAERATARDENVEPVPGKPGRIKREGLGTRPAPDPPAALGDPDRDAGRRADV